MFVGVASSILGYASSISPDFRFVAVAIVQKNECLFFWNNVRYQRFNSNSPEIHAAVGVVLLRGEGMRKRGRLLLREWLMGNE